LALAIRGSSRAQTCDRAKLRHQFAKTVFLAMSL
jgi:hypothetical protein